LFDPKNLTNIVSLSIEKISWENNEKTPKPSISYRAEIGGLGILSQDKSYLTLLAKSFVGRLKLQSGSISFNGAIWNKKQLQSVENISYISNDWSFVFRLSFAELLKNLVFSYKKAHLLPAFALKTFQSRLAISQVLCFDSPVIVINQIDFSAHQQEWLAFLDSLKKEKIVIILTDKCSFIEENCQQVMMIQNQKVLAKGTIQTLVSELEGMVWQKNIPLNDLSEYEEVFYILEKEVKNDRVLITILAASEPDEDFYSATPTLETLFQHKLVLEKI
jgi:ABC-type multidrug transport system ATPase subunit